MPRMQHIDCIEIVDYVASNAVADQGQTVLLNNVDTLANRQGLEPPYFLVEKVDKWYPKGVFHPDKTLFNYLISKGLSENAAQNLVPVAERALSDLCDAFGKSAANMSSSKPIRAEAEITLPETAPELFEPSVGRPKKGADIVSFLRRVWKDPWIDQGLLNRAELARLDPAAGSALGSHLRKHSLPDDLKIPTLSESNSLNVPPDLVRILQQADKKMLKTIRAITERELRLHP
jgi:hypothetical protein